MNMLRVSITPASLPDNAFVDKFAEAIRSLDSKVTDAQWKLLGLMLADIAIFHWPSSFFDPKLVKFARRRLLAMRLAKRLGRTKFVWVAHNAAPHDTSSVSKMAQLFLNELDGIIHLSEAGNRLVNSMYRIPESVRQLVTVHGAYVADTKPIPLSKTASDQPVRAICFGAIRPYKNIEAVLSAAAQLDPGEVQVTVVGKAVDTSYASTLTEAQQQNVKLDLRPTFLSTRELEQILDTQSLVVLPYTNILNSGSAFFALSRHRPVVAPAVGSLPELQSGIGKEWVYLYEGDFTHSVLEDALEWYRDTPRPAEPNMRNYSWERVKEDVGNFLNDLASAS